MKQFLILFLTATLFAQEDSSFAPLDSIVQNVHIVAAPKSLLLENSFYLLALLLLISIFINLFLILKKRKNNCKVTAQTQNYNINSGSQKMVKFTSLKAIILHDPESPFAIQYNGLRNQILNIKDYTHFPKEIFQQLDVLLELNNADLTKYYQYHYDYWQHFSQKFGTIRRELLISKEKELTEEKRIEFVEKTTLAGLHSLEYAYGFTGQFHITNPISVQQNIYLIQKNQSVSTLNPKNYKVFTNSIQDNTPGEFLMREALKTMLKSESNVLINNTFYPFEV